MLSAESWPELGGKSSAARIAAAQALSGGAVLIMY